MIHHVKQAIKDPFFRNSALFFSASMMVAFLNYLFHPVLARLLSFEDFGDVQAFVSLFGMLSTIMGGFTIATVHASVNCEDQGECSAVIAALRKTALTIIVSIFLILAIGSRFFAHELNFSNLWLFVILGLMLVIDALQTFRNGYLQGKQNFKAVSIASIITSGVRLLLAITFVWIGWKSFGAVFGILSAQVISFSYVYWKTRQVLTTRGSALSIERFKEELGYVGFFAFSIIFVTFLYNTDILVVKRFFSPEIAGAYSGISTMANIVYFATSSFSAVLISSVKRSHTSEERRKSFIKAITLISVIGGSFVLLCFGFSGLLTRLLMGARYVPYAYLLPWLVSAFFGACLVNACVMFLLAVRQKGLIYVAACVSVMLFLVTVLRHDVPLAIAQNYFLINVVALVAMSGMVLRELKERG